MMARENLIFLNNSSNKKVFGTYEWASHNANFISGCSHDCKYCYSKELAIRFKRKTKTNWNIEEINHDVLNKKIGKKNGTVMFPSSHDISVENLDYSKYFLRKILESNNKVLIVTKPHYEVIKEICSEFFEYKKDILFRFSIGSQYSEILKFWEPYAPSFEERFKCLKFAFNNRLNFDLLIL